MTTLAFHIGPFQFDQPLWLALAPICWVLIIWIGRRTLSGMGTTTRRIALLVRLLVVLLIVGAIARPQWRREATNVNIAVVVDASDSVRRPVTSPEGRLVDLQTQTDLFLKDAGETSRPGDTVSRVTAARKAYVQSLPAPPGDKPDTQFIGATDGSNLADAVNLALAIPATDSHQRAAAKRILLISDGNQTAGDLLTAADAARAAGIPIDVLPLRYKFDREIIVERIVAPSTARMGQNVNLRVLITSLKPATGRLTLMINGTVVKLSENENSMPVSLETGANVVPIPIALPEAGPQRFEAVFTPDDPGMDAIEQNNRSMAVTFVQSEGRVLVLAQSTEEVMPLVQALRESKLAAEVRLHTSAPASLIDWGAYDCVVMANTPAGDFSQQQQEDIRSYVHDLGGGLVMVGGPESFGAGGWIGSPVADALPIKLDPPQQRKMPRGALALIMHSCEMPRGNYWGQQVAQAAVNNLSRLDMAGILEYSFGHGDWWVHPLSEVGNRSALNRAIASLTFGDMPSFDNLLNMAFTSLMQANAGAKHVIIISDGDPQVTNQALLQQYKANRISISCVLVYPHGRDQGYFGPMKKIAESTGGKFYAIIDEGEFARLPGIFIKEAQVVKRALIWEGQAFSPTIVNAVSEPMRGLTSGGIPPISGYIVAAEREGLSIVTMRGKENDPILAHWQYGLGKSVAFTSDDGARWASSWLGWGKYRAFWEQHVRWAMRPGGNADMRVTTEDMGDRTRIVVEALDGNGERLNFVRFAGRVVGPPSISRDNSSQPIELRQTGPGRYEGVFDSATAGAYVANLRYITPGADGSPGREGNLQAAVTRPYADEFRTLEDNAPLLRLVAERTGGRVIGDDPRKSALFDRAGLTMPVDARPIWMLVAIIALGAFLLDVAVRRVRIDPAMIAASFRKGMGRGVEKANQQIGSLKEARGRAQQAMSEQAMSQQARTDAAAATTARSAKPDPSVAKAKFEASESELRQGRSNQAIPTFIEEPKRAGPSGGESKPGQPPVSRDEGISRLKKARERAQEKFDDEEPPKKS